MTDDLRKFARFVLMPRLPPPTLRVLAEEIPSPAMDPASVCQLVFESLQVRHLTQRVQDSFFVGDVSLLVYRDVVWHVVRPLLVVFCCLTLFCFVLSSTPLCFSRSHNCVSEQR